MRFVRQHRPRETGRIGTKPGFRRTHEVINHEGIALRLDAVLTELRQRNKAWQSLELFAESKPTEQYLKTLADHVALQYIASSCPDVDVYALRRKPKDHRDEQRENILLTHKYFLLYEEMSHAMNYGDIGRLETLFPAWIAIFKATGKHKYATYMTQLLSNLHWNYPKQLR